MTGLNLSLDIQGAAELQRAFAQAPEMVTQELTAVTWEASLLLERETKEETPVGIGGAAGLKGSISAREPHVQALNVIGEVGTPLQYAIPVELGSRPHFPPVQPLADWAHIKLGVPEEEAERVGLAIARKIARRGTPAVHMFQKAFDRNRPQVQRIFDKARERIMRRLAGRR
jgi:hypothetical protein